MTNAHRLLRIATMAAAGIFGLSIATTATASERHMTYTYSSNVLPKGAFELEPWTTIRLGHHGFYMAMDNRLELEVGVTDSIQTAFYFNTSAETVDVKGDDGRTERQSDFAWQGISWEWKFKFLDSVADPVGLGLYFEPAIGPTEGELEAKLLLDKRIGNFYFAWNPIFEYEFEFGGPEVEHELKIENDVGLVGFLSGHVTLGVELRNLTTLVEGGSELESSVFYAGPTVSFYDKAWWTALSVMPQLGAIKGAATKAQLGEDGRPNDGPFELVHAEHVEFRALLGFTL